MDWTELTRKFEGLLRLKTFPLAVKFLEQVDVAPALNAAYRQK